MGREPSDSHTQSSELPERREPKTIFFPSGEYWGLKSARVEEINGAIESPCHFELARSIRQMLESLIIWVKAKRFPLGEIFGSITSRLLGACSGAPPLAEIFHNLDL